MLKSRFCRSSVLAASFLLAGSAFAGPNDLIISEVVEGNGLNFKYIEIYNSGSTAVTLDDPAAVLELRRYANAGITPAPVALTGTIPAGGWFVIANNQGDYQTVFGATEDADQYSTTITHNGNDKWDLYNSTAATVIDGFANDLIGGADYFASNVVAFRVDAALPNNGDWGTPAAQPADGSLSVSGNWVVRDITSGNGNATTVCTPGAADGASGQEVGSTVVATPQLIGAYSIDADTVRVLFDVAPASTPAGGDFTFVDSAGTATISAVNTTGDANVFEIDLSAPLADTAVDSIDYNANSNAQSFVGGISNIPDIRTGTIAVGSIVTIDGVLIGSDGNDDGALQQAGVPAANSGIILRGSIGALNVDDDAKLAGEVISYTDGGGSTRLQLGNLTVISNSPGAGIMPTVIPSTDFLANNTPGANPAEQYEGVLIQVNKLTVTVVPPDGGSPLYGVGTLEDDLSNELKVDDNFFDYYSSDPEFALGNEVDVVGVGWESFGDYVIVPRGDSDITLHNSISDWMLLY